jgi:ABC-type nitrate/sulfonate/bicarbonate transport system permease component
MSDAVDRGEAARTLASSARGLPWIPLAAGAAVWETAARLAGSGRFPPFSSVLESAAQMAWRGELAGALAASLGGLAIGYVGAVVTGVLAGALMARSRLVERTFDVYFDALMAAPTLIYVPVFFALFGVTRVSQIAVVFAYAFFIIAATTHAGIRDVDRRLIEMARAFGASERQVFWRVALPAAEPAVLTGLQLGAARAVRGMVIGEMLIALSGLGAILRGYGARFEVDGVLAVILVILLVSAGTNALVGAVGRRLIRGRAA